MNIILHEPEIPFNTGSIGRTCAATKTTLHLIRPLGFFIDDKAIKRAGMDYWKKLSVYEYDNFDQLLARYPGATIYMATTKARKNYTEVTYKSDDFIMFGKESAGIPEEILIKFHETAIRIPMLEEFRSLNLSNAAAVMLFEALRQQNFPGLQREGQLHRHKWAEVHAD